MYQSRLGVSVDYEKSVELFKEGTALGNNLGEFSIGAAYYSGEGVQQNYKETMKIGLLYVYKLGVVRDYKKANEWFLKAHEMGCQPATVELRNSYRLSWGVEKNIQLAEGYFKPVAKNEYFWDKFWLGILYEYDLNDKQWAIEMHSIADDLGYSIASEYCERLKGEGCKMPEKVKSEPGVKLEPGLNVIILDD